MIIDDALKIVGGYRIYHISLLIILTLLAFDFYSRQILLFVFVGWTPEFKCNYNTSQYNSSEDLDSCLRPSINNTGNGVECDNGFQYFSEGYTSTTIEWNLVCSRKMLKVISQMAYSLGILFSSLVGNTLTDKFGRRFMCWISHVFGVSLGIAISFSPNYETFVVLRFFIAVAASNIINSSTTLLIELFDSERRGLVGTIYQFGWIIGMGFLGITAYLIKDWRELALVTSISPVIWIIVLWKLPESPIWLVANNRIKEAQEFLKKAAKLNRVKILDENVFKIESKRISKIPDSSSIKLEFENFKIELENNGIENSATTKYSMIDLFRDKYLLRHLAIMALLWFTNNTVYYSLMYSTPSLDGNRFVNYTFSTFVEIPAYSVATLAVVKIGRRIPTFIIVMLTSVSLLFVSILPLILSEDPYLRNKLVLLFSLLGKFGSSASFSTVVIYTNELFPTNLRLLSTLLIKCKCFTSYLFC
ncbi:DgyrCDS903 [Dimorphilus gyrociliatus]|uniref:DgyrCDS903 n=1 Tax=Dimorphilus gyrociliatus TaxID=2664684 RepID=A0A7I8V7R6_9ANNE|nr:DgyrCDS903 [Dimorphilus gyrociliatus]